MTDRTDRISVVAIEGDGIGHEVFRAMRRVVDRVMSNRIDWIPALAGLECAEANGGNSLPDETLDLIRLHKVAIKGPTTTPSGGGFKSVNVRLRQELELHSCVRPAIHIPGLPKSHPCDIVVVREGVEGYYDCVEVREGDVVHATAHFSKAGFKRTVRQAVRIVFSRRKKLTLVLKTNILKMWGALYTEAFNEVIAEEGTGLEINYLHIDALSMMLEMHPERFDVLVTENLFGDILSDMTAGLVGGLGVAPGACIGDAYAMFEAVHGSAPDIAGRGIANPTALILSAAMMLEYDGFLHEAKHLREALLQTIAEGDRTGDMGGTLNTEQFTDAILRRL
ncbi:MAG: isocitrate/isopropylmalate family dehydrogenase [Candidatus Uhrbacteria bacterium]|nr:isocitrate/isopropylmalate family dehydrogenase [Candidatus Uhrbacteria bacterium]